MKGRRLHMKLFFIKAVVKTEDSEPVLKKWTLFLIAYSSEVRWECGRRLLVSKSASHCSAKYSSNKPYLQLLCTLIMEVKRREKGKSCCLY